MANEGELAYALKGEMAEEKTVESTKASEEQLAYANILNIGMWLGLAVVTVTFIIYASGITQTFIPIEDLPKYWGMKAKDYIHLLNAPTGWGWLSYVGKGDYMNFIGIATLAGLTVVCYLAVLPIFLRKKDMSYFVIGLLEVAVLALAASGILKVGGH